VAAALDTNCLLRWQLGDVAAQADAVDAYLQQVKVAHVADAAIIEMAYVLEKVYEFTRADVAEYIDQVVHYPKISCNRAVFKQLLPLYVDNPQLSFTDVYLAVCARLTNLDTLLTFDKALAKRLPELASLLAYFCAIPPPGLHVTPGFSFVICFPRD
jgi:predicted nucleic-acid-binding protein